MNNLRLKLAVLLVVVAIAVPMCASAAQGGALAVPVAGTALPKGANTPIPITGTLNITNFSNTNGHLTANGTLTFLLNGVQQVAQAAVAVTQAAGSCPVLSLTLGPLHLDLLGLVIDLNQVNLNITAQSGPGNLLGNLLCAITGLLDNNGGLGGLLGGLLNQITTLLNQVLGQL
jgi:hypothetical protein